MNRISQEEFRRLLTYYPDAGVFVWNVTRGGGCLAGTLAGTISTYGYLKIGLNGKEYPAATLAWLWYYGEWPSATVDHKSTDRLDDRITNLRLATRSQNNANRRVRRDSQSGLKGVGFDKRVGKWFARIKKDGKQTYLGLFQTPEDAKAAYDLAAPKYHGEFARL